MKLTDLYRRWIGEPPSSYIPGRSNKSKDTTRIAVAVAAEAVGEPAQILPTGTKDPAAVAFGRLGGLKGGVARAKALSPKRRSSIARKAAAARWKLE
jgi:hypothetical protein